MLSVDPECRPELVSVADWKLEPDASISLSVGGTAALPTVCGYIGLPYHFARLSVQLAEPSFTVSPASVAVIENGRLKGLAAGTAVLRAAGPASGASVNVTVGGTEPPAHVHSWGVGKVTKPASCEAEGEITFTCTVCGATRTETIPRQAPVDPATPTDATPTDATPTDATPTDATPTDATPTDATPTDATPTDAARRPGDVDGNGKVEPADARLALRASVKLEKDIVEGTAAFLAADVNRDGKVGSDDARLILRASVKLETLTG